MNLGTTFFWVFIILHVFSVEVNAMGVLGISNESIYKDPIIMNNKNLQNFDIPSLQVNNIEIKNLTLTNSNISNSKFENVTFIDCNFVKSDFSNSHFSNVAFIRCKFRSLNDSDDHNLISDFSYSIFNNVLFDSCTFRKTRFNRIEGSGGYILFRNIIASIPIGEANFFNCNNARIRVFNCNINGMIAGDHNVDAISIKSSFTIDAGLYGDITYILNSSINQGIIGGGKLLVVSGSTLSGGANINITGYFIENTYETFIRESPTGNSFKLGFGFRAQPNTNIYLLGSKQQTASFRLFGGNYRIENFIITDALIGNSFAELPDISSLSMKNVVIQGGEWRKKILGGNWENVIMLPSIVTKKVSIQNIYAYRLEYPKGYPWHTNGDFIFETKESNFPFEWPEVKVPTFDEIGLVWWPDVDPGYHGE